MKYYTVLKLDITFKFELDNCQREVGRIITALKKSAKTGMHSKRAISFCVVTNETIDEFLSRVRPVLLEIDAIENFWCATAPRDLLGMNGTFDPMTSRVIEAWDEARYRNYPQHVAKPKSLQGRV